MCKVGVLFTLLVVLCTVHVNARQHQYKGNQYMKKMNDNNDNYKSNFGDFQRVDSTNSGSQNTNVFGYGGANYESDDTQGLHESITQDIHDSLGGKNLSEEIFQSVDDQLRSIRQYLKDPMLTPEAIIKPKYFCSKPSKAIPNSFIVNFKTSSSKDVAKTILNAVFAKNSSDFNPKFGFDPDLRAAFVEGFDEDEIQYFVGEDESVSFIECNLPRTLAVNVGWGVSNIMGPTANVSDNGFRSANRGKGVHIFIVDTGINTKHVEFLDSQGNSRIDIAGSVNFVEDSIEDLHYHGTHCAGIAAGINKGVAPDATIHSVKIVGKTGLTTVSTTTSGIQWVANYVSKERQNGNFFPCVVSLSLVGEYSIAEELAVNNTVAAGCAVVVAAGNNGNSPNACAQSPSSNPVAITVGAFNNLNTVPRWSNYGPCVDIFAPGHNIESAGIATPTEYTLRSGTSMATPHVSGLAALLLEKNPQASPIDVMTQILQTGVPNKLTGTAASPNLVAQFS
eukprot:TRINITY_DN10538_c0_g1_i1.p1 TRINITY_DN10538_c0_g1~~TRINITY_DN10538_c0_g1_i1.p1  ORF type:complete len:507 (-),score=93.63 TRINITY_DN10538_c0_g1_i1:183-1703(-)